MPEIATVMSVLTGDGTIIKPHSMAHQVILQGDLYYAIFLS